MFLVKQLGSFIWGADKTDLVQSTGSFYAWEKNQWVCLFNNSEATITKTERNHFYQIVAARIYEEGEDRSEDEADEYSFLLNESMLPQKEIGVLGGPAFSWTDTSNKRFMFEFDMQKGTEQMVNLFQQVVSKCIYEAKHQQSNEYATEQELLSFWNRKHTTTASQASPGSLSTPPSTPTKNINNNNNNATLPATAYTPAPLSPTKQITGSEIIKVPAKLFLFDSNTKEFQFREDVYAALNNTGNNKDVFSFMLFITKPNNNEIIFAQDVNNDMFMHFNAEYLSCIWVYTLGSNVWTWSLVLADSESDAAFKDWFARCLFERNSQKPFEKTVKKEDVDWIKKSFVDDVQPMEADDGIKDYDMMDFDETNEGVEEQEEEEEEEETNPVEGDSDEESVDFDKGATNSQLAVGLRNDRSFVVRGSQIGVFKHTPSNKLKYTTKIEKLKTSEGQIFSPKKIMLHQEDQSLLLLHPEKRDKIYRMDLNRGDIVEEWKTKEDYPVNEIFPDTKYAQRTSEPTLMGLNKLGFMLLDPRLPHDKVVDSKSFFYKPTTRPNLSVAATTGAGQMVVGTTNGDIRLFSAKTMSEPKKDFDAAPRAKTALPGFGDPIIGIDVSEDSNWVLATCKTYLLVIPTQLEKGSTGFEVSMGKEKPAPRRLQLKREHIAQMGGAISFTPAKFNTGPDKERSIVTSSGPYVIAWNFRKIKQGRLDQYQIKQYGETIVADQFRYGDDSAIVVTTPNDVSMATKVVKTFSNITATPKKY